MTRRHDNPATASSIPSRVRKRTHSQVRRIVPLVEPLESRLLLDGDVSVWSRGGLVVISGDELDNQVSISRSSPDTLRVQGLDGTTINGEEFADIPNRIRSLTVQMRQGGADQLTVQGPVEVTGDLRAYMGVGEFSVEGSAGPVEIRRNLSIRAGKDASVSVLNAISIGGSTNIRAGEVVVAAAEAMLPDFASASFSDSLTIDNPFFPLVPGTKWTYESDGIDDETGEPFTEMIIVEVLPDTRTILGVEARVVRDRVFSEGLLVEDTFDWYAEDDGGNVWYMGEDVTNFEYDDEGNLIGTNNEGHWEAGIDGAQAGIIMLADPPIGARYYQEFQPGGVLDTGEVVARDETIDTPIGTFSGVLRTEDGSVREPFGLDNKLYAPGLGIIGEVKFDIEDDEVIETVRLVAVELDGVPVTQLVATGGFTGTNAGGEEKEGVEFEGAVSIRSGEATVIRRATLEGSLQLYSGAEAFLVDSVLNGLSSISAGEAVTLREVIAEERSGIRGDVDVHIFDAELHDIRMLLGAGDNSLTVAGSEIDVLLADGGRGLNTFEDAGDNTFGQLVLRRFQR